MYSPSRAISQGRAQAMPTYKKINPYTAIVSHHIRVDFMYSPSRAISKGHTQAMPTYIKSTLLL